LKRRSTAGETIPPSPVKLSLLTDAAAYSTVMVYWSHRSTTWKRWTASKPIGKRPFCYRRPEAVPEFSGGRDDEILTRRIGNSTIW